MKYRGINHLAMVTGDMDATIRFWRDLIGMRLINGFEFCYEVGDHDIRKNPVLRDEDPPPAASEGAEPQPGKWPAVTRPTPKEERFLSR